MSKDLKQPLVYSCSGASSAAQMANHIAVTMDRLEVAEMSCIAGVGGDVKSLVHTAQSGRPIIALDGCPLHCTAQILKRHGLHADRHFDLSTMGVRKKRHEDFDPQEAARILQQIQQDLALAAPPESGVSAQPRWPDPVHAEPREPLSRPTRRGRHRSGEL